MYGYWNKLLRVNLTAMEVSEVTLQEEVLRKFLGGSGLGAKLLLDEVDPNVDPLAPENKLFFITGPFCGTNIPTSGRHCAVTKSPLTNCFAESDIGGNWGYELKKTGYDGLILEGKAKQPVYISIHDSDVQILGADHLWGKDTFAAYNILKEEISPAVEIMSIGPAGEGLVRYASIMTDGTDGRALGRTGTGAVMGSKNLKAIVVRGTKKVTVSDKENLSKSIKEVSQGLRDSLAGMTKFGTSGGVAVHESYGNFPLKNWSLGRWPQGAEKISGQKMAETIKTGNYHCKTCIIGCGKKVKIVAGKYTGIEGAGPEYETFGTLGGLCLVDDLEAIVYGNELCNRYGIDTISTGAVIAYTMELYEKNILGLEDLDGIKAEFGNAEAMLQLVKMIGERKGVGFLLGEGVKRIAEELGGLAGEYAIHVKGLELPAHDPRAYNGLALSYATSNRGACHLAGFTHGFERVLPMPALGYDKPHDRFSLEGKAEFVAKMQNLSGVIDSLKVCKFLLQGGLQINTIVQWVQNVIGWDDYTLEELMLTGERIFNAKRLFNYRCGISRKDDVLPARFLTSKRVGPDITTNLPHLGKLLSDYYEYRSWSEAGIPQENKLKELDLI